jgi:hypothetical protein
LLVGFILLAAALQRQAVFRWVFLAVPPVLAAAAWVALRRQQCHEISLDSDGRVNGRRGATDDPRPLTVVFQTPWFIALRAGRAVVPVWPDSLGNRGFRHLAVAARWCTPKEPV